MCLSWTQWMAQWTDEWKNRASCFQLDRVRAQPLADVAQLPCDSGSCRKLLLKPKELVQRLQFFFFVFLLVLLWFQKHLTFDANKLCLIKLLRKHLLCTGKLFSNAWIDNKRWNVLRQNPHADARFRCLMALFNECPELENLYYNRTHVWDNAFIVWNNINYLQKKGVTINKQVRKW